MADIDYDKLHEFATTPEQHQLIDLVRKYGTATTAAKAEGLHDGGARRKWRTILNNAAKAGYSPEHDMTRPTAPGFQLRGTSTLYDKTGNQVMQWVKTTRDAEMQESFMREAFEVLAEDYRGRSYPILRPKNKDEHTLSVYPMGDPHIGMYAWADETGADYDLDIAVKLFDSAFNDLMHDAKAKHALIVNVGDFFHADNMLNRTMRSGNALDVDTRFGKVLQVGVGIMKSAIERALRHHDTVNVINEVGNHDDHTAVMLSMILDAYYHNNSRVFIETKPGRFHYHKFGKVLIGVTHGDTCKLQDLGPIMTRDCLEMISDTYWRVWHTGHVHKDNQVDFRDCTAEIHRTLAPGDAWSVGAGYRSWRSMKRIDYHDEYGEFNRRTFNVRPS